MNDPIPTVLRRDSQLVATARPLIEEARVLRGRVIDELREVDQEIRQLHRRAEEALAEAKENAQAIEEEARQRGRQEAMKECMEQLAAARAEYNSLRQKAEQDMVTLAFHIARRLIGHAIEVEPEVVRDIVGEALMSARGRREIVVLVHPDDKEHVEASRNEYARQLDGVPVYFEADASLQRGGCVIETESGRIDARLETQLSVLRDALLDGSFQAQPSQEER